MKTFANSLLAALLLGASTLTVNAATDGLTKPGAAAPSDKNTVRTATTSSYRMAMYSTAQSPMQLRVLVEKQSQPMTIQVKNAEGIVLGAQHLTKKAGNYSMKFNLENLTDGAYQLEIVSGDDKAVYPLTLSTDAPVVADRVISVE